MLLANISEDYKNFLKKIAIALGIFAAVRLFVPAGHGLTTNGVTVLAAFMATIYLWIFVATDWPSFLAPALFITLGILPQGEMLAFAFGNMAVAYVLATSLISVALQRTGVIRQTALWFMTQKICEGRPWMFVGMFLLSVTFLGLFLDIVPVVLVFLVMADDVCKRLGYEKGSRFGQALVFGILVLTAVTFGATPISHIVPFIFIGFMHDAGFPITFGQYMAVGIPLTIAAYIIVMCVLMLIVRPDFSNFQKHGIDELRQELKPFDIEAKTTIMVFILVIIAWLMPDLGMLFAPSLAEWFRRTGMVAPAILGVVALALIRVKDDKPIVNIREDIFKVPLGVIVFIIGVQTFANTINSPAAGITVFLSNVFQPLADAMSPTMFVWVVIFITILFTQTLSNIVLQAILWFTFLPVLLSLNVYGEVINIMAFGVILSLTINIAFVLPSSQVCAPMAFGSGYLEVKHGVKYGMPVVIAIYFVMMLLCWPLALLVTR